MNFGKRMVCAALAAAALYGNLAACAADAAGFWMHPMFVEGRQVYSWGTDGQSKQYLSYRGTIYVPLRTVAEWIGKEVGWDDKTLTISLSGSTAPVFHEERGKDNLEAMSDHELEAWRNQKVTVEERPDITVCLDGAAQDLKDASGKPVSPVSYQGTTYLPLRAVAGLTGMDVKYQPASEGGEAVFLKHTLSAAELSAYQAYLDTLPKQSALAAMKSSDLHSIKDCKARVQAYREMMETLKNTPCPEGGLLAPNHEKMLARVEEALEVCSAAEQAIDNGAALAEAVSLLHTSTSERLSVQDACTAPFVFVAYMRTVLEEKR